MKKLFALALAGIIAVGAIGCTKTDNQQGTNGENKQEQTEENKKTEEKESSTIKQLTGKELVEWMAGDKGIDTLLLDLRTDEEYEAGHVEGAVNIQLAEFKENISQFEGYKKNPVILYADKAATSAEAVQLLLDNGFEEVYNADGVDEFKYELVQ